jgi:transcriptional regulator with XRE-family HTH domain
MKDRIKVIRKNSGMNQTEFGEAIGVTLAAYSKYETGKVVPDKSVRMLICSKFHVNEHWLETGEGEPYEEGLVPNLVHALMNMPDVQDLLTRLLPKMTEADLKKVNDAVRVFVEKLED